VHQWVGLINEIMIVKSWICVKIGTIVAKE